MLKSSTAITKVIVNFMPIGLLRVECMNTDHWFEST